MTRYNLNALGNTKFENLFQSLLKKIIGPGTRTFGSGPDGGREATYFGPADYPSSANRWDGYWIFQAKFHDTSHNLSGPRGQIIVDLQNELEKITEKYKHQCDNYVMCTNVPLSSVPQNGTHDRIQKIANDFKHKIKNIEVWGYDDICRHIDNYEDIRHAFLSFILPGDLLSSLASENDKQHFSDLKEKVIFPLLHYLENAPEQLPNIDSAIASANISLDSLTGRKGFDATLIDDFLNNHYPEIRALWNNAFEYNSNVVEKRNTIAMLIDERLKTLLRKSRYKYLDEDGRYYHLNHDEFEAVILDHVLKCKNPCDNFEDDQLQPGRMKFHNRIIYLLNEGDTLDDTALNLKALCSSLVRNRNLKNHLNGQMGYKVTYQESTEMLNTFKAELNGIYRSTKLTVVKEHDKNRCRFLT